MLRQLYVIRARGEANWYRGFGEWTPRVSEAVTVDEATARGLTETLPTPVDAFPFEPWWTGLTRVS